jgi:hypothetical protein
MFYTNPLSERQFEGSVLKKELPRFPSLIRQDFG